MAETAISAVGIASLFSNSIDWFNHIYVAKTVLRDCKPYS